MRKGIMGLLLMSAGLVFSQAAFSADMVRYEHDLHHNKATQKTHQQSASQKQGQATSQKTSGQKLQKKAQPHLEAYQAERPSIQDHLSSNSNHPVNRALPDRN